MWHAPGELLNPGIDELTDRSDLCAWDWRRLPDRSDCFRGWLCRLGCVLAPMLVVGCAPGHFLSESGPTRGAVVDTASHVVRETGPNARIKYEIVEVNNAVLQKMAAFGPPAPLDQSESAVYHGEIGVGDIIGLTIFESDSGGLFLPRESGTRSGNYVTLPNQQVDREGTISVPFAGSVKAVGMLPSELGRKIESLLSRRALEPQVVVSIVERRADPVSILGEVGRSLSFTLDPAGTSILGAIARAEGPKYPAYESVVTLHRADHVWRVRLSSIADHPALDRPLNPGDTLYVSHEPSYFVAMGAIGQSTSLGPIDRRLPFQDADLTLMDALGRAGGLNDALANPRAIFVYRLEHGNSDVDSLTADARIARNSPAMVARIYLIDLNDPAGFFYASRFPVHGEDVVYVANAPASDLQKFLTLMLGASASAEAIRNTVNLP
jgi:polysaccharide export outer membrane protein